MAVAIKICGISSREMSDVAVEAGADMIGLVFFGPSPRNVAMATAADIVASLPEPVVSVALTVDADDDEIDRIMGDVGPAMIQAHGQESSERVIEIRERSGVPVIKAVAIAKSADLAVAHRYAEVADRLLFDAKPPPGAARPGGLGRPFDWRIAAGYRGTVPWILSGGLNAHNVVGAIHAAGATAVDVSSGVERAPGIKDARLIRAFIETVRAGETETAGEA